MEKLTFEPPPIYCTACGVRIKRNALYYTFGSGDARHYFCVPCYNEVRSENVEMEGMTYPKSKLEKRKNDEETEEAVCSLNSYEFGTFIILDYMFWLQFCNSWKPEKLRMAADFVLLIKNVHALPHLVVNDFLMVVAVGTMR